MGAIRRRIIVDLEYRTRLGGLFGLPREDIVGMRTLFHCPIGRLLTGFLAFCMIFYPVEPAFARALAWNTIATGQYAPQLIHDEAALKGNIAYVNNNLGAAILKIPGNEVGNVNFGIPYNTPVVFAEYDADSSVGVISVMRLIHMPNKDVMVEDALFTPQDGSVYKTDFEGTNPFWQFIPNANGNGSAPNGAFMDVSAPAFWTAVGLVMQHEQSNIGWIAVNQDAVSQWTTNTCVDNTFLGCVRRQYTTHEQVNTSPNWVMAVPDGEAPGSSMGYLLPMLSTFGNGETVGGNGYASPGGVALRKTARILGVPSSTTINGRTVGALKVQAGVTFINQGAGNNLPHNAFTAFYHQQSQTSWSGLGLALLAPVLATVMITKAAIGPLTGNFGAPLSVIGNLLSLTSNTILSSFNQIRSGTSSGTYTDTGVGSSTACYGGSSNCAANPMLSAYNLTTNLQQAIANQAMVQGTTGQTQPLQQVANGSTSAAWDPRPSIATGVATAPQSAQGGFATQYQSTAITPSQAQKTNTPLSATQGQDVTDSQGNIIFDNGGAFNAVP